ncbi:tautomerase family protein [Clostridium chromiireducens]|uniref:tautomerase family protein n=1 Tax=Clostridium chromiireducens TaxID=225345 RepID=UPI003AF851C7
MSVISIAGWKGITPEKKEKWVEVCTDIVADVLDEPLDEIVVYVNEIERDGWGQAGVVGSNPEWPAKSIRKSKEGE